MTLIPNPDVHETIARQWDAEADHHEEQARQCRREAAHSRLMAGYIKIMAQVAKP
jgi:hypothetical protein